MSLEHQRAVVLLIASGLGGSAFALVRSMVEAYVRGVWLHLCASDEQLERFLHDKLELKLTPMVADIERVDGLGGELSDMLKRSLRALHSYTHTGFLQVAARQSEECIKPQYEARAIDEVLTLADAVALLSATQIARLARDAEVLKALSKRIEASAPFEPAEEKSHREM